MLVLLYYLSQNPDFPESVKPLMGQLKNSQQMLSFLNDLSNFTKTFSSFQNQAQAKPKEKERGEEPKNEKEKPQSPTAGIADDFIQQMLNNYLKNNAK